MPIRTTPPPMPTRATADRLAKKIDKAHTLAIFQQVLVLFAVLHFVAVLAITGDGVAGYLTSWARLLQFVVANPVAGAILPLSLALVYKGIDLWRHPDPDEVRLPAYAPIQDLRWENAIYIGSGKTRDGKQPGDIWDPEQDAEEDLFGPEDEHVILKEKGLFGNIHVKGGVGGGKTSSLIMPFLDQAIAKYPEPPRPDSFPRGKDGRFLAATGRNRRRPLHAFTSRLGIAWSAPDDRPEIETWNPYIGMTLEQAQAEYARLLDLHVRHKWGIFCLDPKGDLTEFIQRSAASVGRTDDVVVLRPDGPYTYNALLINSSPLVQSEMVMDGIEAVAGQQIHQYYRQTMSEWLANALEILHVVDPTRITFKSILRLARSESLRTAMVAEAEAIMRQAQEEEERLARLGKPYTGIKVNAAAIEFFRDWDDVDSDPKRKQEIVSAIKAQAKFFVDSELAPFLCPEMPPTFGGFEQMIDEGKIVVLRMPLDVYGPVAKVLGVLVLADAQQAARARINRPDLNQDRVILFCVDEISAYMNKLTKDFIAMSRQSRVCFLAAHQSQAQLVQNADRGFETSFNDNLRTKISYNAPNAEAGRKESALFGGRKVWKERYTENRSFQGIEPQPESNAFTHKGNQSSGASVSIEEVDRPWFAAEDFVSLHTGQCIIMPFDGSTTLFPRKIVAPQFHTTARQAITAATTIPASVGKPHPVVFVRDVRDFPTSRDHEYLSAAFVQAGYILCEPLANTDGELEGFKFVTDVGTIIVSCDMIDRLQDTLAERLTDPQTLVVFTDFLNCALYFAGQLGLAFERVMGLLDVYHQLFPDAGEQSFGTLFERETGRPLSYQPTAGSWEYHANPANRRAILADSRDTIALYARIGDVMHAQGDDALESLYESERQRIAQILTGPVEPPPAPEPTPAPRMQDPADAGVRDAAAPDFDGTGDLDDPFASSEFPDALADDPTATPVPPARTATPKPATVPAADQPPPRMRRARRRAPGGDQTLFESPLRDIAADEAESLGDADAGSRTGALPSDESLIDGLTLAPDVPSSTARRPAAHAAADADPTASHRASRRRNAGATRRSGRPHADAPTLDLGLPEDDEPGPGARSRRSRTGQPGHDAAPRAPYD